MKFIFYFVVVVWPGTLLPQIKSDNFISKLERESGYWVGNEQSDHTSLPF